MFGTLAQAQCIPPAVGSALGSHSDPSHGACSLTSGRWLPGTTAAFSGFSVALQAMPYARVGGPVPEAARKGREKQRYEQNGTRMVAG